jgi:hypothetical protein
MKYYRCYLLDAKRQIATTIIIMSADDDDARRQGRGLFEADAGFYSGVEIWDRAGRIYSYPRDDLAEAGSGASRNSRFSDGEPA